MSDIPDMQMYRTNLSIRFQSAGNGLRTYPKEAARQKTTLPPGLRTGATDTTNYYEAGRRARVPASTQARQARGATRLHLLHLPAMQ